MKSFSLHITTKRNCLAENHSIIKRHICFFKKINTAFKVDDSNYYNLVVQ